MDQKSKTTSNKKHEIIPSKGNNESTFDYDKEFNKLKETHCLTCYSKIINGKCLCTKATKKYNNDR